MLWKTPSPHLDAETPIPPTPTPTPPARVMYPRRTPPDALIVHSCLLLHPEGGVSARDKDVFLKLKDASGLQVPVRAAAAAGSAFNLALERHVPGLQAGQNLIHGSAH